ncbi:hypothetical protein AMELA_G00209290 [Ameiurus melas]|uniref:Uncharacterized protein n=1 Tax=Ameiurus melas TaxID=219545 RepID=A0A7J6A3V1_AMEME|nr:hypothetical protein AMELA_G00209290 [Ameiurus melas]
MTHNAVLSSSSSTASYSALFFIASVCYIIVDVFLSSSSSTSPSRFSVSSRWSSSPSSCLNSRRLLRRLGRFGC